jgi:hypothetical protein
VARNANLGLRVMFHGATTCGSNLADPSDLSYFEASSKRADFLDRVLLCDYNPDLYVRPAKISIKALNPCTIERTKGPGRLQLSINGAASGVCGSINGQCFDQDRGTPLEATTKFHNVRPVKEG